MEISLSQCQICQDLVAQSMLSLFFMTCIVGGANVRHHLSLWLVTWLCSRLQCLNQPWPMWGNDCLGHFGWIINICSLQRCWWLFFQSVLVGCHKFNLSAVAHRCQFQINLQALYSYHHQAAPTCAMSTPGTCGSLMPGAPCRSWLLLPHLCHIPAESFNEW